VRSATPRSLTRRSMSRRLRALALAVPLVPAALLAAATPAAAEPAPVDISFADCPATAPGDPAEYTCNVLHMAAGTMKIGSITQPIDKPMVITVLTHLNQATGETTNKVLKLRAAPLTVPGGVLGIPGSDFIPALGLQVLPEYVSGFSMGQTEEGAIKSTINLRFKIINPLLSATCGIGSTTNPVKLTLLADMNTVTWYDNAIGVKIADNTFAAPATSGCGPVRGFFSDFRAGLPAASGKNSTTMQLYLATKFYNQG
jgi:hypothetical protein